MCDIEYNLAWLLTITVIGVTIIILVSTGMYYQNLNDYQACAKSCLSMRMMDELPCMMSCNDAFSNETSTCADSIIEVTVT